MLYTYVGPSYRWAGIDPCQATAAATLPYAPAVAVSTPSRQGVDEASITARLMAVQQRAEVRPGPTGFGSSQIRSPLASSAPAGASPWRPAHVGVVRKAIEAIYDLVAQARASAIARTRFIETIEELVPSLAQVVILGAGYDSRPYRIRCLSDCAVFEVDHPGTQASKRSLLAGAGRDPAGPRHVRAG